MNMWDAAPRGSWLGINEAVVGIHFDEAPFLWRLKYRAALGPNYNIQGLTFRQVSRTASQGARSAAAIDLGLRDTRSLFEIRAPSKFQQGLL